MKRYKTNIAFKNGRAFVKGEEIPLHKTIKNCHRKDKDFAKWLVDNGSMFRGFDEPDGELKEKIESGEIVAEDAHCFRDSQQAYQKLEGNYTYYEGWLQVMDKKPIRHGWLVKDGKLYDLSMWNNDHMKEANESMDFEIENDMDYYYFGIPIPDEAINFENQYHGHHLLFRFYNTVTGSDIRDPVVDNKKNS